MDLEPYVTQVQEQLIAAAHLGDKHARTTAVALASAVAPAVRLAVLGAVSAAASEISPQLEGAAVVALLDGEDIVIEVTREAASPELVDDGDATARISLRISESLKTQVEAAARAEAISVNTWLVRAAAAALGRRAAQRLNSPHRVSGWVNG